MTSHEIELSAVEEAVLSESFERERERLRESWGVADFSGYLHLLLLHGWDRAAELTEAEAGERSASVEPPRAPAPRVVPGRAPNRRR